MRRIILLSMLMCVGLWGIAGAQRPLSEWELKQEAAKKEISEAEQALAKTTAAAQADHLRLRIAELELKVLYKEVEALEVLQSVRDTTTDTQRLCSLLWQAGSHLQIASAYRPSGKGADWSKVDWERVKPVYERILRVAPQSDSARRALYQLGRYYVGQKDFAGWRANRRQFIRQFGDKKPYYKFVAEKEIGDSYLFEGKPAQARMHYQQLLARNLEVADKWLRPQLYVRLLQTSWVKGGQAPAGDVRAWRDGLTASLAFEEQYKQYNLKRVYAWLDELLEEMQNSAQSIPVSEWAYRAELSPYHFMMRFYKGLFDHAALKPTLDPLGWVSKKASVNRKVTRVKADMRTIATALEAYLIDWCGGYPPLKAGGLRMLITTPDVVGGKGGINDDQMDAALEESRGIVGYLTMIPLDPFGAKQGALYQYYTGPSNPQNQGWILLSPGPDGTIQINPANDYDCQIPQPSPKLLMKSYDPTNGIFSAGDIFRVKQ
jgi:tetratricopeptide (TPR) repeat protein